jgi:hypothetical protein
VVSPEVREIKVPMVTHVGGNRMPARPMAAHLDPGATAILRSNKGSPMESNGADRRLCSPGS